MTNSTIDLLVGETEQVGDLGQSVLTKPQGPVAEVDLNYLPRSLRLRNLSFLVVDDVPASCKLLALVLKELGARGEQIFSAYTLRDAYDVLESRKIDVVFGDLNLRHSSGVQLLDRLRRHPDTAHLPFVLVTNSPDKMRIADAVEKGASAVLVKPLSIASIVTGLGAVLNSYTVSDRDKR